MFNENQKVKEILNSLERVRKIKRVEVEYLYGREFSVLIRSMANKRMAEKFERQGEIHYNGYIIKKI